jgi:hypothetical protein
VSVRSNTARSNADIIAMAASMQLITTRVAANHYANDWQITTKGLTWLRETEED